MVVHGGKIERRIRLAEAENTPTEVHLMSFPSPEAFASYRSDPVLLQYGELRDRAIRETIIWTGEDVSPP